MNGLRSIMVGVFLSGLSGMGTTALPQTPAAPFTQRTVSPRQRRELLAVREEAWRAWFSNDRRKLLAGLPEAVVAINNGDSLWQDRSAVLASAEDFAKSGSRLTELRFPRTEIQVFGDVAILYSTFELEMVAQGKALTQTGRATEIFVRRHGRWQNAGWHLDSGT